MAHDISPYVTNKVIRRKILEAVLSLYLRCYFVCHYRDHHYYLRSGLSVRYIYMRFRCDCSLVALRSVMKYYLKHGVFRLNQDLLPNSHYYLNYKAVNQKKDYEEDFQKMPRGYMFEVG